MEPCDCEVGQRVRAIEPHSRAGDTGEVVSIRGKFYGVKFDDEETSTFMAPDELVPEKDPDEFREDRFTIQPGDIEIIQQ